MSVQFQKYRAVICGEEHIVESWRGRKLVTDKGSFYVRHIYGDWQIQEHRLFEVATIQADGNGGWLVNGKPLSLLQSLPEGTRLADIPRDEKLRVHKNKICAVAWCKKAETHEETEILDSILDFWRRVSLPLFNSPEIINGWERVANTCERIMCRQMFSCISKPVWLTEFRHAAQKIPVSPQQKQLAKVATELHETKATLRKTEAAAQDTLKEALSKWMRFDPPRMSADTKARIEKAVKLYLTDPEKRSLAKIAADFCVTRKTVSDWFAKFKAETGYSVVTYHRHVSVKEQLKPSKPAWDSSSDADSEQDEED